MNRADIAAPGQSVLPSGANPMTTAHSVSFDLPTHAKLVESATREVAGLRIAITLRALLTRRLLVNLQASHLEIARLCDENRSLIRSDPPICVPDPQVQVLQGELALERALLSEARAKLEEQEQLHHCIESLNGQLATRRSDDGARERRLAERESAILKNFAELQRREQALQGTGPRTSTSSPDVVARLTAEVNELRARIKANPATAVVPRLTAEIDNLRNRLSIDAATAHRQQMKLHEQLEAADRSIQLLLMTKSELERDLVKARGAVTGAGSRVKNSDRSADSVIRTSDQTIIDWMLEEASPTQACVAEGYLSLIGEGPWHDHDLRPMMERCGFSLWELPDVDVSHVVVGRVNWDSADLEAQIAAMEGRQVRIYSQEMWFAKLVTGRDPFDSGNHDLLLAFAEGHAALQYLLDRECPWPEVGSAISPVGERVTVNGINFSATSPLHNFGYQVGVSSGLSRQGRREVLAGFLEAKDLDFEEDASPDDRAHWGRPRSAQRLYRVASHIKWLIEWQGKSPYRIQSNEDWRSDLQWLKRTYYKASQHQFRWPGV